MFKRLRFRANYPDHRAVIWPPLGPYWCSGWAGDESYSIVVAYWPIDQLDRLKEYWPEAIPDPEDFDDELYSRPKFSDRFQCPDYWDEANACVKPEVVAKYPKVAQTDTKQTRTVCSTCGRRYNPFCSNSYHLNCST